MAKRTYIHKGPRDQIITVSWDENWTNIRIYHNHQLIGTVPSSTTLQTGCLFSVNEKTSVFLVQKDGWFRKSLDVFLNGEKLPEVGNSPDKSLFVVSMYLYFCIIVSFSLGLFFLFKYLEPPASLYFGVSLFLNVAILSLVLISIKKLLIVPLIIVVIFCIIYLIGGTIYFVIIKDYPTTISTYTGPLIFIVLTGGSIRSIRMMKMDDEGFIKKYTSLFYI